MVLTERIDAALVKGARRTRPAGTGLPLAQQVRQLGKVRRHAPGLVTPFVAERRRGLGGDL